MSDLPTYRETMFAWLGTFIPFGDREKRKREYDKVMGRYWDKLRIDGIDLNQAIVQQQQRLEAKRPIQTTRLRDMIKAWVAPPAWLVSYARRDLDREVAAHEAELAEARAAAVKNPERIAKLEKLLAEAKKLRAEGL